MHHLITFLCVVGFTITAVAQSKLDSLLHQLKANLNTSDKIATYGKVAWAYIGAGNYELAKRYADSVSILSSDHHDSTGIYKAQYYYGVIGRFTGEHAAALEHFDRYLKFHKARSDSSRVAGVLYQIGVVHSHYGNYEKSLAAYQRCLAIEDAANNAYSVGYTLNAIGIIYKETGMYKAAATTFNKALVIFDSLQALADKTDVLVNLGNNCSSQNDFEGAMKYYRQALEIDKRTGKELGVAMSLANIAFLYDRMKLYDSALVYHRKALAIREKYTVAEDLSRSLIGVGRGYIQVGNFAAANPFLLRALEVSTRTHSKPLLRDVHLNLSNLYEGMKDPEKALHHIKLYQLYEDSVFNEEKAEIISELEIKHEVSDKVKQIALLEKEKQIQQQEAKRQDTIRKASIGTAILIAIVAAAGVYAFRQRLLVVKKDKEIQEVNLRHQLSELKIKALRSQINPHFMFNCLNSINRMIVRGDNEDASLYLRKFSKLLRLIVENGEASRVSLVDELTLIESYIQLEELRFKNKIDYEILVDNNIEKDNIFLPPMILQPFVENSIWHGLMNKDDGGTIKIAVKEEHETLLCLIEDNGVGRDKSHELKEEMSGKTQSVGLHITEERLRLLSREHSRDLIKIIDLKDRFNAAIGTRVEVRIPLT